MKRTLKILFGVVATLLLVAWIAPYALRSEIEQLVKREANAMLQARFDFDRLNISLLRHFPNASLELRGMTLVGVDRFEGDTIVSADRISVVVNPFSLLSDDGFVVKKVLLKEPSLYAHKCEDGAVNWDVMKPSEESSEAEVVVEEQPTASSPATSTSSFRLALRDFSLTKASVRYADDSLKMYCSVAPIDMRLSGDLSAASSELALWLGMQQINVQMGVVKMLNDAELEFDARIAADLEHNYFRFEKNTLRLNAIGLTLDGWTRLQEDGAIAMDIKAGTDEVQFKELLSLIPAFYTREFKNLTAGGELGLTMWAKGELRDDRLPAFELKGSVRDGRFQYSSLPKAVTNIQVEARVANPGASLDKTEVELSKLSLRMAGNEASASFYGTNLMSDPYLSGSLRGVVDLGAIHEVYPLEDMELGGVISADLKAAGKFSDLEKEQYDRLQASGTFVVEQMKLNMASLPPVSLKRAAATINSKAMTLGELALKVGNSDLAANGQLSNYLGYLMRGTTLSGRLYLKSELLDLNELLTAMASEETAAEEPATPSEQPAATAPAEAAMAVAVPANLDLSLAADLHKILMQKMVIENFTGELKLANSALSLNKLGLEIFGGKASASGCYAAAEGATPAFDLAMNLSKGSFSRTFDQLEMVQLLVPIFEKTGGDYSLSLNLSTQLDETLSPIFNTLDAKGEIRSENIRLQNIEVFSMLASALNDEKLKQIDAKEVKIGFTIDDGRLATQPFDLKMGSVAMKLSGSTGLDQTIDYTATVALPDKATNGVVKNFDVAIGGTFTKPTVRVDVKQVAEQAAKNVIDQQVQKLTGSETLSEEILKQAEKLRDEARVAGEKLVAEAEKQGEKLVEEAAKKGALAKIAAEAAAKKLVAEAQKQADKLNQNAEEQVTRLQEKNKEE